MQSYKYNERLAVSRVLVQLECSASAAVLVGCRSNSRTESEGITQKEAAQAGSG